MYPNEPAPASARAHPGPAVQRALGGPEDARSFFAEVIEPDCDSFDPDRQPACESLLVDVLTEAARRDPGLGRALAEQLDGADLRGRHDRVVRPDLVAGPPDLCVIPTRVTVGADVAITARLLAVVRSAWPSCAVALVGDRALLPLLVGGDRRVSVWHHPYPRHAAFLDRLRVWYRAARAVSDWRRQNPGARVVVLDPDSRITQLGLLPLAGPDVPTRVFASRCVPRADPRSLSQLAMQWASMVTGAPTPGAAARVQLTEADRAWAASFVDPLRDRLGRPVLMASLGVGGNPRKAARPRDEVAVLARLAERWTVVLDGGGGPAEAARAATVGRLATGRARAAVATAGREPPPPRALTVLAGARLPVAAAVLAAADAFAGYDSAFQHLAGVLGTPGVAVFVEPPSPTFVTRWTAPGVGAVTVGRRRSGPGVVGRVEAEITSAVMAGRPGPFTASRTPR